MPLLALGEKGDGRAIALAVDGTHRLAYSALASETAGRAHGALWDGLLGWLMRDPRFEPAQVLTSSTLHGRRSALASRAPAPRERGASQCRIARLEHREVVVRKQVELPRGAEPSNHRGRRARARWLQRAGLGGDRSLGRGAISRANAAATSGPIRGPTRRVSRRSRAPPGAVLSALRTRRLPLPRRPRWPPSAVSSRCCRPWAWTRSPPPLWGFIGLLAARQGSPSFVHRSFSRYARILARCTKEVRSRAAICR